MSTGLEQGIAEFLTDEGIGGLYTDATASNRNIWVGQIPGSAQFGEDAIPDPTITVFYDGGGASRLRLLREYTITVQTRHQSYESALKIAHDINDLLQESGGGIGNGASSVAKGTFNGVPVIRIQAQFPPTPLGRDQGAKDGRFQVSQSFTVLTKDFSYT